MIGELTCNIDHCLTGAIGIDSTYNLSKEDWILVLFVGISRQGRSVVLMRALVRRENTERFDLTFKSFLQFGYALTKVVMTDQDPALKKSLKQWKTNHRFYVFHLYRNIAGSLGKDNSKFLKDFSRIQRIEDEATFEEDILQIRVTRVHLQLKRTD